MKNKKEVLKNNSKTTPNKKLEFLKEVKKEAKKEKISYNLRIKNYTNPDSRMYTYGIR